MVLSHPIKDIGKLKEMTVKKQKFKATISMADKHPLSLREQVLPIIKLLVSNLKLIVKTRHLMILSFPRAPSDRGNMAGLRAKLPSI